MMPVRRSVARNRQSVKRVILSSSVAAMEKKKAGPINGKLYTEDDWNDEATLDTFPYHLSKKLAEKLAWDISTEYRSAHRLVLCMLRRPTLSCGHTWLALAEGTCTCTTCSLTQAMLYHVS